ncbi:NAD(P)/FAD-dependent oxidoreductase [Halorarum salinum]|uniref:FAD-dependent oxidoreductase n=1 Tax=Halorarum salinum TaxID=2743089 RepID=A0A7D5QCC7_9EURY|nr:FAD-dependent oxidoreductase [Halobaculum salinum]QLG62560.1 FAD-dependent oxidoreductase [Halobaculum salinum]
MAHVAVVGGGPAGLSAALFAAKNGLDVTVFDTDGTWMHKAHLFNYLGVDSIDGDAYVEIAREQATRFGADLRQGEEVTAVGADGDLSVTTDDGEYDADYVVLATGAKRGLAEELGCAFTEEGAVDVDVTMETSVDGVYATGAMVRTEEWQAVISAGDGAAAALNVLTREKGEHFHDFDTPADADAALGTLVDEG